MKVDSNSNDISFLNNEEKNRSRLPQLQSIVGLGIVSKLKVTVIC